MTRFLSVLLTWSMLVSLTPRAVWGQAAGRPKIHIVIIEGEGAINNMRQRVAREPIVEVRDENDKPVAGAAVLFALPSTGPSGAFANGLTTFTATTDNLGRAIGVGLKPNGLEGAVQMKVTATYQGQTVSTTINMTNAMGAVAGAGAGAGAAGGSAKLIGILVAVGAAAGVGAAVALRGGGTATPSPGTPRPPVSISIGTGTVGGQP